MWKSIIHYLHQASSRDPGGWYPLLAVYYLTYACDFHCPYCSDGSGVPYPRLRSAVLRGSDVGRLLRRIRQACDSLVITGGEPLYHPDFGEVLEELPRQRFDRVILTTIGHDIAPFLPAVAAAVQHLVFSLDTMEPAKAEAWWGKGPGLFQQVLDNIERARSHPGRRYQIVISSVATPDNLEDLYGVYEFARTRGFRLALCPVLRGVKPDERLRTNPEYRRVFDFLIAEKRKGADIQGTVQYLEHMRDLRQFRCRPSTVLAVSPGGEVFYPCLEIGTVAGNLLEAPSLHALRASGKRLFGPEPQCPNQCQSACALGFSLGIDHPWSTLHEAALKLRAR